MSADDSSFTKLERTLGALMLTGVLTSAVCLATGVLLFLFVPEGRVLPAVLTAGLFVLMATPMLRVAVAVVESIRMRDWAFVLSTTIVAVLIGLTLAHATGKL